MQTMNPYILYTQQQGGWMHQPDQSGYTPPLQRSYRVVDLSIPPRRHATPAPPNMDPGHCHRSLKEHRRAVKESYRRMVRDQMKAEASRAYQHQQDLEPFPWDALDMRQPLLPTLNTAIHESGGDAERAWQMFDRRSWQEKVAEEAADEEREAEVRRRADEMIRKDDETKEDGAMRELFEGLPTFKFPDITNTVSFASVIRGIQDRVRAHITDITISLRGHPHLQLELSQVLSWVQQDCNQENPEKVLLISVDELDRYCNSVADRIFHHLATDFKKHNYLHQLRNAKARSRKLQQVNSELRVEIERLRAGIDIDDQLEHNSERIPLFAPSVHQHHSHPSQPQRLNSGIAIFNNQVGHDRRSLPLFEPSAHRHYFHPPQQQRLEYQQPRRNWIHQRSSAAALNGLDMTMEYQNNTAAQNGDISQMNYRREYSPMEMEMEEIHHERRGARRAHSMPPPNRARARARDLHTDLVPVTEYGTVARADEIGPIYDYSNLGTVSMRGGAGGPYSLLEDSDSEGDDESDGKATNISNITPSFGKGTLNRMKRYADDDDEDDDSFYNHSSLKFTKQGDTKSNDPNNQLWEGGPPSSSGIGKSSAIFDNPTSRRNDRHRGRRGRNGTTTIAPGLAPFKPKVDPYAEVPNGFRFGWNQADSAPLDKTWTTLDPKTGTVKYEEGAQEARENPQESYMWNPLDARNTPLAATFGTSNVVYATEVKESKIPEADGLTAKSLQRLDKQSRQGRTEAIDEYIDITSTPGSPNAPPSEPSIVEYRSALAQGSMAEDRTVNKQPSCVDADVRKNFIDNINAMHDVRPAPGVFERRNQGWVAKTKAPVSYINEFGDGNIVEVTLKTETRTRKMNESGGYDGKDLGQVKKRHLRGFFEMINARNDEMVRASKEYHEWQAMSLEDRMERLTLIRQPIDLWKGKPGADQNDQHELKYLPKFYERRISRKREKQRMRAMLAEKARQKKADDISTSFGTTGTGDTLDTFGTLGDCDDLPVRGTSSGSQTPRLGNESLQEMLQRAIDIDPPRDPRSRSRSSSKSVPVTGSTDAEPGFRHPDKMHTGQRSRPRPSLYSGGSVTGNSVTEPRQSRPSSAHPSPFQAASPNTWCSTDAGSNASSTVRGVRNAPLGSQTLNGSGTERSSDGTNAANGLHGLIAAYDDSPTLRTPTDIDIPPALLTEDDEQLYSYATGNMGERGRVITMRLHAVQETQGGPGDVLPKFTPGAIAERIFGGVVQEFQLHPEKRTAVVVFMHPREARSFVHHVRNVRQKGTEHDIRDLQIEASWFRGIESQAILPAQPNLLKHSITASGARRCILISHIPKEKSNSVVFQELSASFGTILVRTSLITPQQNYILQSEGKQALIEFANLQDAIRAYDDLNAGLVAGYENADPRYTNEMTEKRPVTKDYCGCLGCEEKRTIKVRERESKERKRNEQMREDDDEMGDDENEMKEVEDEDELTNYSDTAGG
ncbi:hypothetical protein V498_01887 [Pseudogymnoascus sp. VKM F-4517 (FW-2822)]|nr:hypothetical protein V498_01887 [Pseudogymnoascus sp. VKM F-4517 (FW-2822)]